MFSLQFFIQSARQSVGAALAGAAAATTNSAAARESIWRRPVLVLSIFVFVSVVLDVGILGVVLVVRLFGARATTRTLVEKEHSSSSETMEKSNWVGAACRRTFVMFSVGVIVEICCLTVMPPSSIISSRRSSSRTD